MNRMLTFDIIMKMITVLMIPACQFVGCCDSFYRLPLSPGNKEYLSYCKEVLFLATLHYV